VFSPNGDGINDEVQIRFVLFKAVDAEPTVRIFDLSGREVVALKGERDSDLKSFTWAGLDAKGDIIPPGIYFCRIDGETESGQDEVLRSLSVVY